MSNAIDEIHVALNDMTTQVLSQAPKLRPVVFPSYLPINSIFDLCVTKSQREKAQHWMNKKNDDDVEVVFVTNIDYPRRRVNITQVKVSEI
jgi:hypothetical protein